MAKTPGVTAVDHEHHTITVSPYPALREAVSQFYAIPRADLAPLTNEAIVGLAVAIDFLEAYYAADAESVS